jgi:hypothetical protein
VVNKLDVEVVLLKEKILSAIRQHRGNDRSMKDLVVSLTDGCFGSTKPLGELQTTLDDTTTEGHLTIILNNTSSGPLENHSTASTSETNPIATCKDCLLCLHEWT